MNRRFALAAALAVVGSSFVFLAPTADAVGAPTSAWWSRLATTTPTDELPVALPVPAPETPDTIPAGAAAPNGQLVVEGTPDGAVAIAAARWELADGESSPSLTLPIGEGSSLNPESIVLACRAATPWSPPESAPGSWDTKPLVDGFTCVNGIIAEDLSAVTFGVQPLVSGNALDLVFAPGKAATPEVPAGVPEPPVDVDGSSFRWTFPPPSADNVEVVAGSGFSAGEGDRFITPTTSATPDFGTTETSPADTSLPAPVDSSPAFEAPAEAASPALPPEDLAPSVPDVADAVPAAATAGPANRTIGFILLALSALMAGWAYLTSNPAAAGTTGLGRFAAPVAAGTAAAASPGEGVVGGLSRFARPRTTPPTRLS